MKRVVTSVVAETLRAFRPWLALLVLLSATLAPAATVDDAYSAAIQAYYGGDYQRAVDELERLRELPLHHEDLFYNLGCAYMRLGKLGPAIYNFERALAIDPSFEDAHYNLRIARKEAALRVKDVLEGSEIEPWWIRLAKLLSIQGWWSVVLVAWWLVIGIVVALRFVGHGAARAGLLATNGLLAVLLLGSVLLLAGRLDLATRSPEAVILPDTVSAREGPNTAARTTFELHSGLRVRVRNRTDSWIRIRLPNGLEGWVEQDAVGVL